MEDDGHLCPGEGALGVEPAHLIPLDDAGLGHGGHGGPGGGGHGRAVGEAGEEAVLGGGDPRPAFCMAR